MRDQYFFGYGSLVNAATHAYRRTQPVRLAGFKRMWRHTVLRDIAFLTVVPDAEHHIDGLIAHVPENDWTALDIREEAYTRDLLTANMLTGVAGDFDVQLYQTRTDRDTAQRHPILLSYLDCVVQGYHQIFGATGVSDFFDSTSGWDAPVLNDRSDPQYPRHQVLSKAETALVDHHLAQLSARVEQL